MKAIKLISFALIVLIIMLLSFSSCSTLATAKQINNIEEIEQEIYENLYVILDNNTDENIIRVYNKYYYYLVYAETNNYQYNEKMLNSVH